jgi:chromodomain-helicase-DNA-binding protein 9
MKIETVHRRSDGKPLRSPQPKSVAQLVQILRERHGALLADSMGLGKTASAVVAASMLPGIKRKLVIAPKSALVDWEREIFDWARWHGLVRAPKRRRTWHDVDHGWVLINYEKLDHFKTQLRQREWDLLIIDEGHATKEPDVRRSILIYGGTWDKKTHKVIPHRKALIVSGTPLKNRIEELFTQLHFLDPIKWPSHEAFVNAYYEADDDDGIRVMPETGRVVNATTTNLDVLHRELQHVMVRTHKDDVPDMPSKKFEQISVHPHSVEDAIWFYQQSKKLENYMHNGINVRN